MAQRNSRWGPDYVILAVVAFFWVSACVWLTVAHERVDSGTVIAIDFGTSNTCVGLDYSKSSKFSPVPDQGNRCIPSYVSFTDDGPLVGQAARDQILENPERTIYDIKRLIGRRFRDLEVQETIKRVPYQVINKGSNPAIQVTIKGKEHVFTPEEVVSKLFERAKKLAEDHLDQKVTQAVVAVPASFNEAQRQAIRDAGILVDLGVVRLINEPTAASIAHDLDRADEESQILVYDLGGGTLDVTLVSVDQGVFEVLAVASDPQLSGEVLDRRVVDKLARDYGKANNVDISNDKATMHRLKLEVEKAKIALSNQTHAHLEIESFFNGEDFSKLLTRAAFEDIQEDVLKGSLGLIDQVLKDANQTKEQIDHIVLAGGASNIPKVIHLVESYLDKQRSTGFNPVDSVVLGAAIQAAVMSDPEGWDDGCMFFDITNLSLGVDTVGDLKITMIPRNIPLPTRKTKVFSTAADNQETVRIRVLEGERAFSRANKILGELELRGITPAPRGVPQIEVAFEIDANFILRVIATDKGTGHNESIYLENICSSRNGNEVDRIVEEGERFAEEDQAMRNRIIAQYRLAQETKCHSQGSDGNDDREGTINPNAEVQYWLEQIPAVLESEHSGAQKTEATTASPRTETTYYLDSSESGTGQAKPSSHDEL